jgi:hypothetical protein
MKDKKIEIKFHFLKYISMRGQTYSDFPLLGYHNFRKWDLLSLTNIFGV